MERSSFIKLLEEYRNKAVTELYKECKVQASLMLSEEFKAAIAELEATSKTVNTGFEMVSNEVKRIATSNALTERYNNFCYSTSSTCILDNVVNAIASKIRNSTLFQQKESEIKYKFESAIRAAKATRSPAKLKELADALGIETPSIEVTSSVSATVDTEFVKEKIKSVLLLS